MTSRPFLSLRALALALLGLAATSLTCRAEVLLYEGFQYGGSSLAMNGLATGGTTGLTGSYAKTGSASGTAEYTPNSIGFSGISASGGALALNLAPSSATTNEGLTLTVGLDLNVSPVTGTVYQGMLVRLTSNVINNGFDSFVTRINDGSTNAMLTGVDSPNSGNNIVVSYLTGTGGVPSNGALSLNTSYYFISRWTNVGTAGGGAANLWVFNEADYADWQAGGALEANLDTASTLRSSNSATTQVNLVDGGSFIFGLTEGATAGTDSIGGFVDELRLATTLAEVALIPEPGAFTTLGLALVGVVFRRGRRRRR